MTLQDMVPNVILNLADASFVGLFVLALTSVVPALTSILTLAWVALRVYEMDTVQCWIKKRRCPKND